MSSAVSLDDYIGDMLADAPPAPPVSAPAPVAVPAADAIAAPIPTPAQAPAPPPPAAAASQLHASAALSALAQRLMTVEPPPVAAPASRPKRWLCFGLGGESFAIELLKVQEVQRVPSIVPVRGAAPDVLGVINLRGEIVHVIDVGVTLGLGASDARSEAARVVVLEEGGLHAGLLVSSVASVVTLDDAGIERSESTLRAFPCPALSGIARIGGSIVALLDGARFLK